MKTSSLKCKEQPLFGFAYVSIQIEFNGESSVKFLSHPRVETRIYHTAKDRKCAVSLVRKELLTLHQHLSSQPVLLGSALLIFLIFCVVYLIVCLCFVHCLPNVASVAGLSILDYSFAFLFFWFKLVRRPLDLFCHYYSQDGYK